MKISLVVKFLIGLTAGLCAALFPRLSAGMVAGNSNALDLFNFNYLILSALFAVLIGAVTAILEWESSRSPKDIFMAALAIPGILSGALNTTVSVNNFEQAEIAKLRLQKVLEEEFEIPTLPGVTRQSDSTSMISEPDNSGLVFVASAHAGDGAIYRVSNYGVGVKRAERQYIIVLAQAATESEAKKKTATLKSVIGKPGIIPFKKMFLITTGDDPSNKSEALIEAIRLKRKGLKPSLMEVE